MTDHPILCKCGAPAYRVSFEPDKITGQMVATFHCQVWGKDHVFQVDNNGDIIKDDGRCKRND